MPFQDLLRILSGSINSELKCSPPKNKQTRNKTQNVSSWGRQLVVFNVKGGGGEVFYGQGWIHTHNICFALAEVCKSDPRARTAVSLRGVGGSYVIPVFSVCLQPCVRGVGVPRSRHLFPFSECSNFQRDTGEIGLGSRSRIAADAEMAAPIRGRRMAMRTLGSTHQLPRREALGLDCAVGPLGCWTEPEKTLKMRQKAGIIY